MAAVQSDTMQFTRTIIDHVVTIKSQMASIVEVQQLKVPFRSRSKCFSVASQFVVHSFPRCFSVAPHLVVYGFPIPRVKRLPPLRQLVLFTLARFMKLFAMRA